MSHDNIKKFPIPCLLDPATGCWVWMLSLGTNGYGQMKRNGQLKTAHYWYYKYHKGDIKEGLEIDHTCKNKLCVNPDHLEAVTHIENNRRANAILSPADVSEIRSRYKGRCNKWHHGVKQKDLAREFGVSVKAINGVITRSNWKDI